MIQLSARVSGLMVMLDRIQATQYLYRLVIAQPFDSTCPIAMTEYSGGKLLLDPHSRAQKENSQRWATTVAHRQFER